MKTKLTIGFMLFALFSAVFAQSAAAKPKWQFTKWEHSYKSGYTDKNGEYIGGSQLMHLVPYKGKMFAGVSYWMDKGCMWYDRQNSKNRWGQILRLDSPNDKWQLEYQLPEKCLRPEFLDVVTFGTDGEGQRLRTPVSFLVTGNYFRMDHQTIGVRCFARNDQTGKWEPSLVHSSHGNFGEDYSIRAIHVHRDRVTGVDMVFATIGVKGIFSGVYDPEAPGRIKWNGPPEKGNLTIRPLAIVDANNSLIFPSGKFIFRRIDGATPKYEQIHSLEDIFSGAVSSPHGGIRGLTSVPSPSGKGDSLVFMWAPVGGGIRGDIYRLDKVGNKYVRNKEVCIGDILSKYLGGGPVYSVLGAYNSFMPIDVGGGELEHIIGFEAVILKKNHPTLKMNSKSPLVGYYRGGAFAIRNRKQEYRVGEINGGIKHGDTPLVATVSFGFSPFKSEPAIYMGGLDPNAVDSTNLAWIYKGVVKGKAKSGEKVVSSGGSEPSQPQPYRTWKSKSGKTIEARLVKCVGSSVILEKRTGKKIKIGRSGLSSKDRRYLSQKR